MLFGKFSVTSWACVLKEIRGPLNKGLMWLDGAGSGKRNHGLTHIGRCPHICTEYHTHRAIMHTGGPPTPAGGSTPFEMVLVGGDAQRPCLGSNSTAVAANAAATAIPSGNAVPQGRLFGPSATAASVLGVGAEAGAVSHPPASTPVHAGVDMGAQTGLSLGRQPSRWACVYAPVV